tara:strand:- start:221 stop:475 length:255 start_codon:yes stop_codon:yes gene_type:complete
MSGFEITIRCDSCTDGLIENEVGGYTPDRWMGYDDADCPECGGSGQITLPPDYFLEDIEHAKMEYGDYDIIKINVTCPRTIIGE